MMQIHFTGHGLEVTESLKTFTEEKLQKLEKHFEKITKINVVFRIEKLNKIAEATLFVAKGEYHAHAQSEDMYASVDELLDKLNRQLVKHKEKIQDHRDHRDHRDTHDDQEIDD